MAIITLAIPVGADEAYKNFFGFIDFVVTYELGQDNIIPIEIEGKKYTTILECIKEVGMKTYYKHSCGKEEYALFERAEICNRALDKTIGVADYFRKIGMPGSADISEDSLKAVRADLIHRGVNAKQVHYLCDKINVLLRIAMEDIVPFKLYAAFYKKFAPSIKEMTVVSLSDPLKKLIELVEKKVRAQALENLRSLSYLDPKAKL